MKYLLTAGGRIATVGMVA